MLRNLKIGKFAACCKWQQIFPDFGTDVCSSLLLADKVAVQAVFGRQWFEDSCPAFTSAFFNSSVAGMLTVKQNLLGRGSRGGCAQGLTFVGLLCFAVSL